MTGNPVPTAADVTDSDTRASVSPMLELAPGPYTAVWLSRSAEDGDDAQGFFTFVVGGGPVGILSGSNEATLPAADLLATLSVTTAEDGASLLRVSLNNTTDVERVRVRLSRPDLGEDLLTLQPTDDGSWVLNGNEVAVPGAWHASVIVRRTNIFDDAQADFAFNVDPLSGLPQFL